MFHLTPTAFYVYLSYYTDVTHSPIHQHNGQSCTHFTCIANNASGHHTVRFYMQC